MISKLLKDTRVRYLLVGGSSAGIEYGLFALLVVVGMHAGWANAVSFLVGFLYTFILHNSWSFAGNHKHASHVRLLSYALLAGINVVATSLLVTLQVDILAINPFIAKVVCMGMVVVWNYLLLSRIIFRNEHGGDESNAS